MSLPEGYCFERIDTIETLERLEPEWRRLWSADQRATPFQSPEWLVPWWREVGEGELAAAGLRDASGQLVGLLPFYIYCQPETGRRDRLLLGAGTSDYLGGLFHPAASVSASDLAGSAMAWIREGQGLQWDRTILHQMRADSWLLEAAGALGLPQAEAETCSLLSTSGVALPAKMRLNVGRYRRRAEGRGELRYTVAQSPEEAMAALELLIELHTRRWTERGEPGVLTSPAVLRHHRAAVPRLQTAGLLRMTTLSLGETPIAVLYCLVDPPRHDRDAGRRFYGYLIGIDGAQAELSPGTLLLREVLDHAAHEGIATFDMLRGGEQYKRFWGARIASTWTVKLPESGV